MIAAEIIQAAIGKLETLKAESSLAPWELEPTSKFFNPELDAARILHAKEWEGAEHFDRYLHVDGSYAADAGGFHLSDAQLIVTLHRTIDAQLAILRFGIKRQEAVDWARRLAGDKHREAASLELDLARAILGESS